jgi:hypothetical protein
MTTGVTGGMTGDEAFRELGLSQGATVDDVRDARRRLAKIHHPDRGGDPAAMRTLNQAAAVALQRIDEQQRPPTPPTGAARGGRDDPQGAPQRDRHWSGVARDAPSFTVEALPAETFEGLLVVASWMGEVLDDDPPYRLDTHLYEPIECWCRLDVMPDAGSSTVSLTIAAPDGGPVPAVESVRDAWVDGLNRIDWE